MIDNFTNKDKWVKELLNIYNILEILFKLFS